MLTDSLSGVFGQFSSTALLIDSVYVKYCSVLITFLSKWNKVIFLETFFYTILCDQKFLIKIFL